ncbi:hypothetical protein [Allomuricauda sp. d1]|uniref:hypothetical protein n=1 Tax=Allomuricauda sp. d1 TaxID=3136725 RepID=UPI0031E3FB1D
MKRVKDLDLFKYIREIREFEFGVFHYFDGLVIGEIKEGVLVTWKMGEKVVNAAVEIYGEDMPIAYISNRIHDYAIVASDWIKFYKNRHQLDFYSVVGNTKGSFASIMMERMFFKNSIRQFTDLDEAVQWSLKKIKARDQKTIQKSSSSLATNME